MHFYRGSGVGAARYFEEGHRGAEVPDAGVSDAGVYYTEGAGVVAEIDSWRGGERQGVSVAVGPGGLVGWVEGVDLGSGEVKGLIRSGGVERLPLRFVEVVVNNPKSLSIVASQNPVVAAAVDAVLARQADEIAGYLSRVAVTRSGSRGGQVETGGLEVQTARVKHLTSREGDPHRHVHLMLNTRVRTLEGEWRGLHSVAVRQHIGAVNERGSRVLVTDRALREVLAGEGYTLGADGEIDQARDAVKLLSKRTAVVAQNRDRFEAVWRAAHPGREPSQRVRNGWDREAWEEGRKAKPHDGESVEEMVERVRVELADAGFDFTPGARRRYGHDLGGQPAAGVVGLSVGEVDCDRVADDVVAVLSAQSSAWTVAELTARVEAAVAGCGVLGDASAVGGLVEDVHARATARCVSVLDVATYTPTVMSRHLTSPAVIDADARLNLGLAGLAGGPGTRDGDGAVIAGRHGFDTGQADAVGAVCGKRRLEVIVGPAGAGKTRMLDGANRRLAVLGREMVLVAPTLKAAQVAAGEVGVEGLSVSKLLYDHGFRWDRSGRWSRLAVGEADPVTGTVHHGPGRVLSERSVVVVDEAGLVSVDQACALIDVAAETGASLRLVGDPRQLGAVGRGGVIETAARWAADGPVLLDQVHRFLAVGVDDTGMPVTTTDTAYAALSLRLREGGDPGGVFDELVGRGQVVAHSTRGEVIAALAGTAAAQGGDSDGLAVTVATNADAADLNAAVRGLRVAAGQVDDTVVAVGVDGVRIGVGDRIVTRRNDTARDVANRETWTVEHVTDTGTVHATRDGRHVVLDPAYLAEHTQLGYATTDYGNQGVTAERSVTWVTEATTSGGLYVGITRGRYDNTVHVVAANLETARGQLISAAVRDRTDRGLDAARSLAEADATAVTRPARAGVDLAEWRTAAELDAAAQHTRAWLAKQLRDLQDMPTVPDDLRRDRDRAERAAADVARAAAAAHHGEADRITASRDDLAARVTADYLAARDDARIITAGPGRLHLHAGQVEAARDRCDDIARRWGTVQLPGGAWSDHAVNQAAQQTAGRIVGPAIRRHHDQAAVEERTADSLDRQVTNRSDDHQRMLRTNQANVARRAETTRTAEAALEEISRRQQRRDELTAIMTPDQVATIDRAREALVEQQQQRQPVVHQGPSRQPQPGPPRPAPRDRDQIMAERARQARQAAHQQQHEGPSIEM